MTDALESCESRLRHARVSAGYKLRADAVKRFGWNYLDYVAYERGQATLSPQAAKLYARSFSVSVEWLLFGTGEMDRRDLSQCDQKMLELHRQVSSLTDENSTLRALVTQLKQQKQQKRSMACDD